MKIYSDKLTGRDLWATLPEGVTLGHAEMIRNPRKAANAWIVYANGSSIYMAAGPQGGKAATWDEYGIWIDRLYRIDPAAIIGHYKSRIDFLGQTKAERERVLRHFPADHIYARTHRAPWFAEKNGRVETRAV